MKYLKNILIVFLLFNLTQVFYGDIFEEIFVRGSIFPEDMLSKRMIIIESDELEKMKVKSMGELFMNLPGVDVRRRGAGNSSFDVTMRGSNFEQTLLLVNGVPVNNPQTGHFNADLPFTTDDIDRIEIMSGGNSVFHGISGFAGIINIILKRKERQSYKITGGENKYTDFIVSTGKSIKKINVGFSAKKSSSSGFYKGREFDNIMVRSNLSSTGKIFSTFLEAGYIHKDFGAMGFYAPYPSLEKSSDGLIQLGIEKKGKIFQKLSISHNIHYDNFILDRYNIELFGSESKTTRSIVKFHNEVNFKDIFLSGGIDINFANMNSSSMGIHSEEMKSFYVASGVNNNGWGVDLGLRVDFRNKEKPYLTYYYGIFKDFQNKFTLRFNSGKSIRFPSFTELFYNSPVNKGNLELLPEESVNYEFSLSLVRKKVMIDASIYYRNQIGMIDWIKEKSTILWHANNLDRNKIIGVELLTRYRQGRFNITGSFEKLFIYGINPEFTLKYGFRFSDMKFKINFDINLSKRVGFAFNFLKKRIYETSEIANLMNIYLNLKFKKYEMTFHVDNLFNSIIEEVYKVKIPGRWIYVSLRFVK